MKKLFFGSIMVLFVAIVIAGVVLFRSDKSQVCLNKQAGNYIGCLLAGPVALSVQVTAIVDEVSFYSIDNANVPVSKTVTNSKEVVQTLYLPTHSRYYFVVKKGDQTYQSKVIGFSTSQANAKLTIHALDQWEGF
jgi:hypothetical protein